MFRRACPLPLVLAAFVGCGSLAEDPADTSPNHDTSRTKEPESKPTPEPGTADPGAPPVPLTGSGFVFIQTATDDRLEAFATFRHAPAAEPAGFPTSGCQVSTGGPRIWATESDYWGSRAIAGTITVASGPRSVVLTENGTNYSGELSGSSTPLPMETPIRVSTTGGHVPPFDVSFTPAAGPKVLTPVGETISLDAPLPVTWESAPNTPLVLVTIQGSNNRVDCYATGESGLLSVPAELVEGLVNSSENGAPHLWLSVTALHSEVRRVGDFDVAVIQSATLGGRRLLVQ